MNACMYCMYYEMCEKAGKDRDHYKQMAKEFREALESVAFLQQPKSVNPEFWEKRSKIELIKTITTDTDICREVLTKYPQSQEKE